METAPPTKNSVNLTQTPTQNQQQTAALIDPPIWDAYKAFFVKEPKFVCVGFFAVSILFLVYMILRTVASSDKLQSFLSRIKSFDLSKGRLETHPEKSTVETDEKGNVKPPGSKHTAPQEDALDGDQLYWLIKMEIAYEEPDECIIKVDEYYNKLKSCSGEISPKRIEASYLLSRYRCGDESALSTLKSKSGASSDAYHANFILARYYKSIEENVEALKFFDLCWKHSPDIEQKLNATLNLGKFLADTGKMKEGIKFLKEHISTFVAPKDNAKVWKALGDLYEKRKQIWQKHLCFEKALRLNPDDSRLRFSLAYSYGETPYGHALAAHHYKILRAQAPRMSIVSNNLSVIYHSTGLIFEHPVISAC